MQKFKVGDKVKLLAKSVPGHGKLEEWKDYYKKFPYGFVTKYTVEGGYKVVVVDNIPDSSSGNFFLESDLELVSSANENMQYIVRYTDKDQEDQTEWDLETKEEVLEFIEDEEDDIDWDYDVEVLEVSKTFTVEKASKYKLVEE